MTNGEKIQKDFQGCEVCEPIVEDDIIHVIFADKKDSAIGFDWSWWNAEYKEPTTKNDLGVDAISRQAVLDIAKASKSNWIDNSILFKRVNELPSVTPQECKVGKWIFAEGIRGKDNVEKCSCCGSHWKEAIIYRTDTQEYLRTRLLYCPNCGSRNEVEE